MENMCVDEDAVELEHLGSRQSELQCIRLAYLINQHVGTEVLERELKLLEALVDRDLNGDGGIGAGVVADMMTWSRHGGRCCEADCGSCVVWYSSSPDGGDVLKLA